MTLRRQLTQAGRPKLERECMISGVDSEVPDIKQPLKHSCACRVGWVDWRHPGRSFRRCCGLKVSRVYLLFFFNQFHVLCRSGDCHPRLISRYCNGCSVFIKEWSVFLPPLQGGKSQGVALSVREHWLWDFLYKRTPAFQTTNRSQKHNICEISNVYPDSNLTNFEG